MKQKKKKIRMAALITVLSVLVLFFAVFLLFQTRKIEVTGNQYCQDEELVKWFKKTSMHSTPSISGGSIIMEM